MDSKKYKSLWYQKNREKIRRRAKVRYWQQAENRRATAREYKARLKMDVIKKYGGACVGCGIDELAILTIDHVHDDGIKDRHLGGTGFYCKLKRQPRLPDLQVLCFNCQLRKRNYGPDISSWKERMVTNG